MPKFTYNWSGQTFEVDAPPGTTEAAARAVFDQQVETGGLTNLAKGQSVNALTQLKNGLLSAASQVRGAVNAAVTGATSAFNKLTAGKVASPMNVADFVNVGTQVSGIGPLNGKQVQGLLAQAAATAGQLSTVISPDKGIGKFGITPGLLESSGFIKPGTIAQFGRAASVTAADQAEAARINSQGGSITAEQVAQNRALTAALQSPTVWTGKGGIDSLTGMLGDTNKQLFAQTDIMTNQFSALQKTGLVPAGISTANAGALLQAAGKVGAVVAAAWSKGASPAGLVSAVDNIARSGQLAVNFTDTKVPDSLAGEQQAPRAKNTVNRTVLDQAYTQFIGNAKVPPVNYGQDQPSTNTFGSFVATSAPRSAEAAILEGQIEGKENGQKVRREQLAMAEAQGDAKAIAYWQQKITEADQEIAQLRAQLARLG